jgi:hypothetical protein
MKLFAIPNLSASSAEEVQPWEFKPSKESQSKKDKPSFIEWGQHPGTRHCYFSAFEGTIPSLRVNVNDNPPVYLHGFVADYDTEITENMWDTLPSRCKMEFLPAWGSSTFSKGARLVWEFEKPLLLTNWAVTKIFLKLAAKKMNLKSLLPGFDEAFCSKPDQYYEVGRDWRHLSSDVVPEQLLWAWVSQAGDGHQEKAQVKIPIEEVAKEVQNRFPGKWNGPFELKRRGVRFWDPDADNSSAAVVRENGMQCFTGTQGFVPWAAIFGQNWVDRYAADSLGEILADWWYDGRNYWTKDPTTHTWFSCVKDDFRLLCKVRYGLNSLAGKANASEVDNLMFQIQHMKRVDGVIPRVHFPDGAVFEGNKRFLNNSTVKCLAPAEGTRAWGEHFPWLARFFDTFFVTDMQKEVFMSWLSWFYTNASRQRPRSGQAMFIAGDKGAGKTFLSTVIIASLVGGHHDSRAFLVGEGGNFTDYIMESPLLTMDDAEPANNPRMHSKFSNIVKRMVANPSHHYDKKFQSAGQTTWLGRIMVTCNLDPESLRILPSLEISSKDKIIFLRASGARQEFLPMEQMQELVRSELPHFARWLTSYQIPDELKGENRFGVLAYHDPFMADASHRGESSHAFAELIDEFRARYWKFSEQDYWVGTSTKLLSVILSTPELEGIARVFSDARIIGRMLSRLVSQGCPVISQTSGANGHKMWRIDCREATPSAVESVSDISDRDEDLL